MQPYSCYFGDRIKINGENDGFFSFFRQVETKPKNTNLL